MEKKHLNEIVIFDKSVAHLTNSSKTNMNPILYVLWIVCTFILCLFFKSLFLIPSANNVNYIKCIKDKDDNIHKGKSQLKYEVK